MGKPIIIGLGTGRCGTRSMAKFLTKHGIDATHEKYRLNWNPEKQKNIEGILDRFKPDVAYYWLPYVEKVIEKYPDAKFICFKRDRNLVIKSYLRDIIPVNPIVQMLIKSVSYKVKEYTFKYSETVTQEDLDNMDAATRDAVEAAWDEEQRTEVYFPDESVPRRKVATDLRDCISDYWDEYYDMAEMLESKYPDNFKIFDMLHALNTEEGNNEMLNFIGVTPCTMAQ